MARAEKPKLGKLRELTLNLNFGEDFTGDKAIYTRIVTHILLDRGWQFGGGWKGDKGNPIHIGDNKYEFDIIESDAFLAGMGGRYLFWIEDNEVKVKKNITWMS